MAKISNPNFPDKVGGIILESHLSQRLVVPMNFNNENYKIYCHYDHRKGEETNKRELNINVPNIPVPPKFYNGLYASFEKFDFMETSIAAVKGRHNYYHNKEAAEFFTKNIQPILEEKLPEYMKELIKLDK